MPLELLEALLLALELLKELMLPNFGQEFIPRLKEPLKNKEKLYLEKSDIIKEDIDQELLKLELHQEKLY